VLKPSCAARIAADLATGTAADDNDIKFFAHA